MNRAWHPYVDLGGTGLAAVLLYVSGGTAVAVPLALILGLLGLYVYWERAEAGWMVRAGLQNVWLWLFLATAVNAALIPYDLSRGQEKLMLVWGAVGVYWVLTRQSQRHEWLLVTGVALLGPLVAGYFLLTHDWTVIPAKIEGVNRWALAWSAWRPTVVAHQMHPNVVGGVLAFSVPYLGAVGHRQYRMGGYWGMGLAGLGMGLTGLALLISSSRGAWLALVVALGFGVTVYGAHWLGGVRGWRVTAVWGRLVGAVVVAGLLVTLVAPMSWVWLMQLLPGPASGGSRWQLWVESLYLVADVPLMGAGFHTFPGYYAQYIHNSPFYIAEHSHNMFIDILFEQGPLGLLAFIGLWGGSWGRVMWQAVIEKRVLLLAVAASGWVLLVHGLVDDVFYGSRAVLLLLVPVGLANQQVTSWFKGWQQLLILAGCLVAGLVVMKGQLPAYWQVNRGVVALARLELADFPANEWRETAETAEWEAVQTQLLQAQFLPAGGRPVTANHRLGLIAMTRRDYEQATVYLAEAAAQAPGHPGIQEALAFSYVWQGAYGQALPLVADRQQLDQILRSYQGWWPAHGYPELGVRAQEMREVLAGQGEVGP